MHLTRPSTPSLTSGSSAEPTRRGRSVLTTCLRPMLPHPSVLTHPHNTYRQHAQISACNALTRSSQLPSQADLMTAQWSTHACMRRCR